MVPLPSLSKIRKIWTKNAKKKMKKKFLKKIIVNLDECYFTQLVIVSSGQVFLMTKVLRIFGQLFPLLSLCINFDKMGWATFWEFFSQTHLVTLVSTIVVSFQSTR
jgi:hypothetical protein